MKNFLITAIIVIGILCFQFRDKIFEKRNYNQSIPNMSNSTKQCYVCKGTGTEICSMCNGTGINNMGIECGCLSYNKNMQLMGKPTSPYHGPSHTCSHCNGTGIE